MPIYFHNVQHGHRISNFSPFQRDGLYIFAPQEGQMSLVSLFTSGLLDVSGLQFIYTEAGTSFIKPLVHWLDKVLEAPPVDYDDQEEPCPTERYQSRRKASPRPGNFSGAVFLEKNQRPASYYFKNNFYFTIETEDRSFGGGRVSRRRAISFRHRLSA